MRKFRFVTLARLVVLSVAFSGAVRAEDGIACVKTQCEGKSQSCVQALYAENDVCMKAGRKKCDSVPIAEKFNCLRSELSPCAKIRNKKQDGCLAEFRTCYAACGPLAGKRADYWCVVTAGSTATAGFCTTDPASDKPGDQCETELAKAFTSDGPFASMACESL